MEKGFWRKTACEFLSQRDFWDFPQQAFFDVVFICKATAIGIISVTPPVENSRAIRGSWLSFSTASRLIPIPMSTLSDLRAQLIHAIPGMNVVGVRRAELGINSSLIGFDNRFNGMRQFSIFHVPD